MMGSVRSQGANAAEIVGRQISSVSETYRPNRSRGQPLVVGGQNVIRIWKG